MRMVNPGPVTVIPTDGLNTVQAVDVTVKGALGQRVKVFEGSLVSSGGTPETLVYEKNIAKSVYVKFRTSGDYSSISENGQYIKVVEPVTASTDKPIGIVITKPEMNGDVPPLGHYGAAGEPTYPNSRSQLREVTIYQLDVSPIILGGYIPNSTGSNITIAPNDPVALTGVFNLGSDLPELKKAAAGDWSIGTSYIGATIKPGEAQLVQFGAALKQI